MMNFELFVGIDYSGAETPESRLKGIQVYMAKYGQEPQLVVCPASPPDKHWNWSRKELAEWIVALIQGGKKVLIGLDHAFSFPSSYMKTYNINSWSDFLEDFCKHWKTDTPFTYVDFVREENPGRVGKPDEFRITETWTSSTKSVFQFDIQGSVAKSTHAGIPWLKYILQSVDGRVHVWPFDGWQIPEGKSILCEVYPSIFRRRYKRDNRTSDEQDAYSVAHWLEETTRRGLLERYLKPPLTVKEMQLAKLEGWILGIS